MTLTVNFTEAHRRHWKDAKLLYAHRRWGNADHLFGFSAECGLKAVMTRLGMPLGFPVVPASRDTESTSKTYGPCSSALPTNAVRLCT